MNSDQVYKLAVKWNMIFYFLELVYTIFIGLLLVPLYLKFIPKDIYGYWLATGNVLVLITMIDPGLSDVIKQKVSYNYGLKNRQAVGTYSSWGVVLSLLCAVVILFVGFIFYLNIGNIFPEIEVAILHQIQDAFLLTLLGTSAIVLYFSFSAIIYGLLCSKSIGIINVIGNYLSLFTIVFFLIKGYGLISLGIASVIRGGMLMLLSGFYVFWKFHSENIRLNLNRLILKDFTLLTGYNFLGKMGNVLMNNMNSFLVARYVSPEQTSLLKFTQTVPEFGKMILLRILYSFTPALPGFFAEKGIAETKKVITNVIIGLFWILGLIVFGFLMFNERFIDLWIGKANFIGERQNILIICLLFFSFISKMFYQVLFSLADIKIISKIAFGQSILYISFVTIAAILYGVYGLLFTGVILELLFSVFFYWKRISKKLQFINSDKITIYKELFYSIIAGSLVYILFYFLEIEIIAWHSFGLFVLLFVILYILLLYIFSHKFRELVLFYHRKNNK